MWKDWKDFVNFVCSGYFIVLFLLVGVIILLFIGYVCLFMYNLLLVEDEFWMVIYYYEY